AGRGAGVGGATLQGLFRHGPRVLEDVLPARHRPGGRRSHQRPDRRPRRRRRQHRAQSAELGPRAARAHRGRGAASGHALNAPIRYTGERIRRVEDPRLLRGRGRYLDDLALARMLTLAFVRSPHAHARVVAIDAAAARALPGVAAVVTAADLHDVAPLLPRVLGDGFRPTQSPPLADGEVSFVGEAVAAVLADTPYIAADARDLVQVEYDPRPPVTTMDDALAADRVLFRRAYRRGDVDGVFAGASIVLRERFTHGRCAPVPLEPRGVVADWDGESLTVWASTQTPSILRTALASALGLDATRVRILVPDVGGGFGLKVHVFPE